MIPSFWKTVLFAAIGHTINISAKDILRFSVDVSEEQLPIMLRRQAI